MADNQPEFDLGKYEPDYVFCRTFGHMWSLVSMEKKGGYAWIQLNCSICTTARLDEISTFSGSLLSRKYEYPEGYCHQGQVTRDEYRKQFLKGKK